MNGKYRLAVLACLALLVLVLRLGTLLHPYPPFSDSESQQYISAIRNVSKGLPAGFGERYGSFYITTIPYGLIGRYVGLYSTIFIVKGLFLFLAVLLVYSFAEHLNKGKWTSLLAVALFAVMPTAVLSQNFANYTGGFFVAILSLLSLWLFLHYYENRKVAFLLCGMLSSYVASLMWNGGMIVFVSLFWCCFMLFLKKWLSWRSLILFGTILSFGAYFIIYPHLSINVGPDLSNVNVISASQIPMFNFLTFISQQNLSLRNSVAMDGAIITGFFMFMLPILLLFFWDITDASPWLIGLCAFLLVAMVVSLVNARFESFVILPASILAAYGTKYIRISWKLPIYLSLIGFMAILAMYEVWPFFNYF